MDNTNERKITEINNEIKKINNNFEDVFKIDSQNFTRKEKEVFKNILFFSAISRIMPLGNNECKNIIYEEHKNIINGIINNIDIIVRLCDKMDFVDINFLDISENLWKSFREMIDDLFLNLEKFGSDLTNENANKIIKKCIEKVYNELDTIQLNQEDINRDFINNIEFKIRIFLKYYRLIDEKIRQDLYRLFFEEENNFILEKVRESFVFYNPSLNGDDYDYNIKILEELILKNSNINFSEKKNILKRGLLCGYSYIEIFLLKKDYVFSNEDILKYLEKNPHKRLNVAKSIEDRKNSEEINKLLIDQSVCNKNDDSIKKYDGEIVNLVSKKTQDKELIKKIFYKIISREFENKHQKDEIMKSIINNDNTNKKILDEILRLNLNNVDYIKEILKSKNVTQKMVDDINKSYPELVVIMTNYLEQRGIKVNVEDIIGF